MSQRSFGKIETGFWLNPKTNGMPDVEKLLYLYLITSPHGHSTGIYVLPLQYAACDLGWNGIETVSKPFRNGIETVSKRLRNLSERGLIQFDDHTNLVRIIGWWGHNSIPNENIAKSHGKYLSSLPCSKVKANYMLELSEAADIPDNFRIAMGIETVSKRFRNGFDTVKGRVGEKESRRVGEKDIGAPEVRDSTKKRLAYSGPFKEWWALYPKKIDKKKAFDAYKVAMRKAGPEALIEGLRYYAQYVKDDETPQHFIIHPHRWLERERWNDRPKASRKEDLNADWERL